MDKRGLVVRVLRPPTSKQREGPKAIELAKEESTQGVGDDRGQGSKSSAAMVRQSDVKGAYSRVGDPSVKRSSAASSSMSAGRCMVIVGFLAVAALFVGLGRSSSHAANDDNDRSGQAHHASAADPATTTQHQQQQQVYTPADPENHDEEDMSRPSGGWDEPPPSSSSYGHEASPTSAGRGEDDGYDDEEDEAGAGARTATPPGSTASEDGDGTSPASHDEDDDKDDESKDEPNSSKEGEEDDDGDDRSDGPDSDSKSSPGVTDHGSSSPGEVNVPVPDETNPYEASSTDPDKEEKHVVEDLKLAEAREVKAEEAKAQSTLGKLGSSLRIGLGKLFGDKATDQEIEDIAVAVEAEVTTEVNQEIEVASEQILEDEVDKVRDRVERLRDDGQSDEAIARDVASEEDADLSELRHSVDEIESRVEQSIKTRESMAEKKILEDKLSKKLGKKVKLTFVEQEERFDGMDEAMEQLPSLRGSPSAHKKKKKNKKRGSGGGGTTSKAKSSGSQPSSDSGGEGDW